jgi:hypothetical protein
MSHSPYDPNVCSDRRPFQSYRRLSRRAILLDLSPLVAGVNIAHSIKSRSSLMTDFIPQKHGFKFSNGFVNVILDIPGMYLATRGRCGGMAYTALDYYYARQPIPSYTQVPECEGDKMSPHTYPLGAYRLVHSIFLRQLDTMVGMWPFGRALDFVFYTAISDYTLFQRTVGYEVNRLKTLLYAGTPVPLGLIGVRDILRVGENHQVVAYGCELDPSTHVMTSIFIYDPNHPNQSVTISIDKTNRCLRASTGKIWRGLFVRDDYVPCTPPSL